MDSKLEIAETFRRENCATFFHGNCVDMLKTLPTACAQLVVTSPPYNVGKEYEESTTVEKYLEFQELVIKECIRILRPGGSICWQLGTHTNGQNLVLPLDLLVHPVFATYFKTDNLRLRNRIIWTFEHGLNCNNRFSGRYETILWYSKGDDYTFDLNAVRVPQKYPGKRAFKGKRKGQFTSNPLGKNPGDVWSLPNVKANHVEKTGHPCQFPIELPERLILALTKKGDLVVDPFLGSGTTAIASIANGRKVAGADIKLKYLKIARSRVSQFIEGTLKRRPYGKPIFEPPPNTTLTTNPFKQLERQMH